MKIKKLKAWDTIHKKYRPIDSIVFYGDGETPLAVWSEGEMYGMHQIDLTPYTLR